MKKTILILLVCLYLACFTQPVLAEIFTTGDVDPADPASWDLSTYSFVGKTGNGTMDITSGSDVQDRYGYIGYDVGSFGEVSVDGFSSTWENFSALIVGQNGNGKLNITNGGNVFGPTGCIGYDPASLGEVSVDGGTWENASALFVGKYGFGTLNITNGGNVINGYTEIGYGNSYAQSEVTVDGGGSSLWNAFGLTVGNEGVGTLNITNGGDVSNSSGIIGYMHNSTGKVTVDGAGSTYTNNSSLTVGNLGSGTLNITNGGAVSNSFGYIGSNASGYSNSGTGEVTVDGVGSTWTNSDNLFVGNAGSGTLNITNGGTVNSHNMTLIGDSGEVKVSGAGSTWTNSYDLMVRGEVLITDGGMVSNDGINIGGSYYGMCQVTVDGDGSTLTSDHSLFVGNSASGTLNITNGGVVSNRLDSYIGGSSLYSMGFVMVDGVGSKWTNCTNLIMEGHGILNIINGGLVNVAGNLTIESDDAGNSSIYMASGGMLALYGDADDSLFDFLGLIGGTDAICYWDDSISKWADITGATYGVDYTLDYLTTGDLTGYTVLTVPEPTTLLLLGVGGLLLRKRQLSAS